MTNHQQKIFLSPAGRLRWEGEDSSVWQEQWFRLGASRRTDTDAVRAFWHTVSAACITALCHVASPDSAVDDEARGIPAIPLPAVSEQWLAAAPPMPGGEYLNLEMLQTLWKKLLAWCAEAAAAQGGIAAFLQKTAPQWRHVGRLFFHLAENKMDAERPFAFLATYATGLNEKGQPRHVPLSHALRQYASAQDKPALLRLLEPLHKAARALPWVQGMVDDGSIYQPWPWRPDKAHIFLKSADTLEACGIGVRLPDWWRKRRHPVVNAVLNMREGAMLGAQALVDVDIRVAIGEVECSTEELARLLNQAEDGLVLFKEQWVELDKDKLRQVLDHWNTVEKYADGNLTFAQGMRLLAGFSDSAASDAEDEVIRTWSSPLPGKGFRELLSATRREARAQIHGLRAALRPYQACGVEWLSFLGRLGLGACLADDMGLGKTMQILALLLKERGKGVSLLVAPASLLDNWQAEARRFAPALRCLVLHGMSKRELNSYAAPGALDGYDLVLVSYAGCAGIPWLTKRAWRRVIADEAQAIKNAATRQSKAVRALTADTRIALTGTPIENGLSDLWALFDFLNPGLLGSARTFTAHVKKMRRSEAQFSPLRRIIAPYILRRMKTDKSVIDSLPDKTEVPLYCHLTKGQARIYVGITTKLRNTLESLDASSEAPQQRRMVVLQSLMLLKQVCNHPAQAGGGVYSPEASGKFQAVGDLCATLAARQEKLLVFTQFREIVEPLARYLTEIFHVEGLTLHGGVPVRKRQAAVEAFQSPDGPPFMVLTLKVGGTGLTLTEAGHVIHFDRWWNPAVEDQATDRAYRIGQKKNVLVHKCITRGTLEEKIDALIRKKRELADEVLGSTAELNVTALSDEELFDLVRLDAAQVLE
ncbi:DEAD/DEAH box helicase [Desulfovibrio sp. ZJ369]|uniref:DEAD/DEAH box helicase n=1 Tax=Desulfovibrio sp. ZJ369 TaxID=2709793 RepID=UPI0013ECD88F|nr:DEAD/DEAH box helicase [Desulfovibrio sp. ZJ369]